MIVVDAVVFDAVVVGVVIDDVVFDDVVNDDVVVFDAAGDDVVVFDAVVVGVVVVDVVVDDVAFGTESFSIFEIKKSLTEKKVFVFGRISNRLRYLINLYNPDKLVRIFIPEIRINGSDQQRFGPES